MHPWALISPASRGIGLALTRRVLQTTNVPVVATARKDPDKAREEILKGLDGVDEGRLEVLRVDVLGSWTSSFIVSVSMKSWNRTREIAGCTQLELPILPSSLLQNNSSTYAVQVLTHPH